MRLICHQTQKNEDKPKPFIPPLLFSYVAESIYRGGYPKLQSHEFLKRLDLRTIISVTPNPLEPEDLQDYSPDLQYIHIAGEAEQQKSRKKKEVLINIDIVVQALEIITNPVNQPVFVHCLNGKQITSLIIACFRIYSGWSVRSALTEYARFSEYARSDIAFLENYQEYLKSNGDQFN